MFVEKGCVSFAVICELFLEENVGKEVYLRFFLRLLPGLYCPLSLLKTKRLW